MKDTTSNSSLRRSTPFSSSVFKRLYVLTGKGGVGKTTLAMALSKYLLTKNKKVLYNSFDQEPDIKSCKKLNIPYMKMSISESTKKYMAMKLNSTIIASWIMKTPFFSSLFNMLPGIGYMIFLGHVINLLENDPELIIVLDTPSSGHAMTMFESPSNFRKIFNVGIIVNDIDRMTTFMDSENVLKVIISTLPSLMAVHEGLEMKENLDQLGIGNSNIIMNNSFKKISFLKPKSLPKFLKQKIKLENEVLDQYSNNIVDLIPHSIHTNKAKLIEHLVPYMENLV